MNPIITRDGTKRWIDINGKFHRVDGPAYEASNGSKFWSLDGFYISEQTWQVKVLFNEVKISSI